MSDGTVKSKNDFIDVLSFWSELKQRKKTLRHWMKHVTWLASKFLKQSEAKNRRQHGVILLHFLYNEHQLI